ncbi:MAG TPA: purine-nucleoside phosphorylase [Oscillatoriaceae cyanobacterium]
MSTTTAPILDRLRATMPVPVSVAVVLGSGIRALEDLVGGGSMPYTELPNFPTATVAGHAGVLSWGRLGEDGPGVMVARGRFHLYEGHGLTEALTLVEFFKELGVPNLVLTNAAGGLRADWAPGDLMLIADHLNFQYHQAGRGERFEVVEPYDDAWRKRLAKYALDHAVPTREGVYVGLLGPSYETMAENRYLMFAGADAVGMSTVPEAARAASHAMKVTAISCITNISVTPKGAAETSHQEVVDVAKAASERMEKLLRGAVLTAQT